MTAILDKTAADPQPIIGELQRKLDELTAQQAATAGVLKVIASSSTNVQPVFDAIATSANRLIGGFSTAMFRFVDDTSYLAAFTPTTPAADEFLKASFPRSLTSFQPIELVQKGETVRIPDTEAAPDFTAALARARGYRSIMFSPLMSSGSVIGMISVTRAEPSLFADHHVQLLETFADQAVIAIENSRLFNETREALERQTATSEVLKVISNSSGELTPVFNAMLENAVRICEAKFGNLFLVEGDSCRWVAGVGTPQKLAQFFTQSASFRPTPGSHLDRVMRTKQVSHTADDTAQAVMGAAARFGGARSTVCVPMVKDKALVGAIFIYRTEVRPFTDKQIDLVESFADQAVIAIENARLFDEVRARTRDLSEALTYQTGSSNILKVIASSPTDVGPVLKAVVESACELCGAYDAVLRLREGDNLCFSAHHGPIPVNPDKWPINRNWTAGRSAIDRKPVHTHDMLSSEGDEFPEAQERARHHGHRTILSVPLLSEGEIIGTITLRRLEVNPFGEKQVALLQTFADQAVIAIGNVRLFEQVQERTRDLSEALTYQTGSSTILKVIASSPTDVAPVLKAIVESACELCDAVDAIVLLKDVDSLRTSAHRGPIPLDMERWPISRKWVAGRAFLDRKPVHVHDLLSADGDEFPDTQQRTARTGTRSILSVPLLLEGESIGAIVLRRTEMHPFSEKQIALLQTFADQAVIAIGNVRMFEQVQERTKELSLSLDELRTAQDRLIQTEKLASLGQLTAGIAHEIKNPLNFVNNFSALSAELVGEMKVALSDINLDKNKREELDEIAQMLKDNLEKVVQHGERADSIVKNMLQHSREGSGEHRPIDINAIVDESLNLAYHGARAEKAGFNITLDRNFDPTVGMVDVYPQEITRVLLNLISNGFYAANKRRMEAVDGFIPTLSAATRNLGEKVEIRIRDNGTGIPAGVIGKIFNPFFTTKPAGEGTGLGLSMSHDIIVKQHGGSIDVETDPGQFTEFKIVLPRTSRR